MGSSPHMRGTPAATVFHNRSAGIIPAYAGNTSSGQVEDLTYRDHPRICGEHSPTLAAGLNTMGSSPHMRGTRPSVRPCAHYCGIIPAYAGNTLVLRLTVLSVRDHPRICGEHPFLEMIASQLRGSSPHMRGTLITNDGFQVFEGIIPAYAGNTIRSPLPRRNLRDHPRICGEHSS